MNLPPRRGTADALQRLILSPIAWCLLATADFVATTDFRSLRTRLGDTDDAVRLVSVRDLLHGAPWFDTTLPRIGAPVPLVSHWSRLIDAPLAVSIGVLTPALGSERAELITRILWPAMLMLALQLVFVREAHRRGGAWAAALALIFTMTSITAIVQFSPGRVDHHNAMIACTVAGLLFLERSLREADAAWPAGVLLGLALAIGYEPIALSVPALAIAAIIGVWTGNTTPAARAVTAATATMLAALVVTARWSHWMPIHCDALAVNLPLASGCCAVGLWFARGERQGRAGRLLIAAASAAVGLALFAALEPACLRGPYGQVSPELLRIWMDSVMETKSVFKIVETNAPLGWSFILFAGAGAFVQVVEARRRADAASALAAAIAVLALILGCWALKLMPYASWLAAMSLAVWVASLRPFRPLSVGVTRCTAALLLSQATMFALVDSVGIVRGAQSPSGPIDAAVGGQCVESQSFAPLSSLAPGLVAADLELGPYIVATSEHRVVATPHHRLQTGILANRAILTAPPEEAVREIRRLGVNYVALCQAAAERRRAIEAGIPYSLEARLLRNERVDYLEEVSDAKAPIRIWRVRAPPLR
jgi:hypothetical protein